MSDKTIFENWDLHDQLEFSRLKQNLMVSQVYQRDLTLSGSVCKQIALILATKLRILNLRRTSAFEALMVKAYSAPRVRYILESWTYEIGSTLPALDITMDTFCRECIATFWINSSGTVFATANSKDYDLILHVDTKVVRLFSLYWVDGNALRMSFFTEQYAFIEEHKKIQAFLEDVKKAIAQKKKSITVDFDKTTIATCSFLRWNNLIDDLDTSANNQITFLPKLIDALNKNPSYLSGSDYCRTISYHTWFNSKHISSNCLMFRNHRFFLGHNIFLHPNYFFTIILFIDEPQKKDAVIPYISGCNHLKSRRYKTLNELRIGHLNRKVRVTRLDILDRNYHPCSPFFSASERNVRFREDFARLYKTGRFRLFKCLTLVKQYYYITLRYTYKHLYHLTQEDFKLSHRQFNKLLREEKSKYGNIEMDGTALVNLKQKNVDDFFAHLKMKEEDWPIYVGPYINKKE